MIAYGKSIAGTLLRMPELYKVGSESPYNYKPTLKRKLSSVG
ncbi:hypothetical protein BMS3Abin17_00189 [archaeon BMS3Abin17]|nr:hypothetical protein BMS3Abin17_00189 [archaeon BMS3Abin17]